MPRGPAGGEDDPPVQACLHARAASNHAAIVLPEEHGFSVTNVDNLRPRRHEDGISPPGLTVLNIDCQAIS